MADQGEPDQVWREILARPAGPDGGGRRGWPLSAICTVAVLSAVAALLLFMNLFGVGIRSSRYDPAAGGSMAEWFEAIATLVAVPVAVLVGVRQLRTTSEGLDLGRRRFIAEEIERSQRQRAEDGRLRDAVQLRVRVGNVVDLPDLASETERAAAERWSTEYRYRGWDLDPETSTWSQGTIRRSTAEQLAAEPSPLVPKPWFVTAECANTGAVGVTVLHWTVQHDHTSMIIDCRLGLRPGETIRRRLGAEAGLAAAYAKPADVEAAACQVTVGIEGREATDRPFRVVARRE